jgi:superfamily II DNA/RNA helicase
MIFFRTKAEAHKAKILFSLLDFKAVELHGDLSQEQVTTPNTTQFLQHVIDSITYPAPTISRRFP